MPITFEEMVQSVINTVREREQMQQVAVAQSEKIKEQETKITALETEIAELKKPKVVDESVREPDKQKPLAIVPVGVKEVK